MGFFHEIRQRFRGDILAPHDLHTQRRRRMQNRLETREFLELSGKTDLTPTSDCASTFGRGR
jgi:hypothetical protein